MDFIDDLIGKTVQKTQTAIEQIKYSEERMLAHLNMLKDLSPSLVKTLAKQKLEIVKMSPVKTGLGSNDDWKESDSMKVGLTVKPTTNTFKFIKDVGYDKHGGGRNQERLNARATKLSDAIKKGTGLESVMVNPYSFEYGGWYAVNEDTTNKTILVDFWIKA